MDAVSAAAAAAAALCAAAPEFVDAARSVRTFAELPVLPVRSPVPYAVRVPTVEAAATTTAAADDGLGTTVTTHFTEGGVRLVAARLPGDFRSSVLVSARSRLADWLSPASMRPVGPTSDWWVFESSPVDLHRGELTLITVSGGVPLELLFLGMPTDLETRLAPAETGPRWAADADAEASASASAGGGSGSEPGDFSDSCEDRDA